MLLKCYTLVIKKRYKYLMHPRTQKHVENSSTNVNYLSCIDTLFKYDRNLSGRDYRCEGQAILIGLYKSSINHPSIIKEIIVALT